MLSNQHNQNNEQTTDSELSDKIEAIKLVVNERLKQGQLAGEQNILIGESRIGNPEEPIAKAIIEHYEDDGWKVTPGGEKSQDGHFYIFSRR